MIFRGWVKRGRGGKEIRLVFVLFFLAEDGGIIAGVYVSVWFGYLFWGECLL
jgi:hypothetical protein